MAGGQQVLTVGGEQLQALREAAERSVVAVAQGDPRARANLFRLVLVDEGRERGDARNSGRWAGSLPSQRMSLSMVCTIARAGNGTCSRAASARACKVAAFAPFSAVFATDPWVSGRTLTSRR